MNETQTVAEPKRITLSDINVLERGVNYMIHQSMETEYDKCIYNALEIPEDTMLMVRKSQEYTGERAWNRGSNYKDVYRLDIVDKKTNSYYTENNTTPIRILMPRSVFPTPNYSQNSYENGVKIGELYLRLTVGHEDKTKLYKEDDKFYIRKYGCNFDLFKLNDQRYGRDEKKNTIYGLFYLWKNMESTYGLKDNFLSNRTQLNEFLRGASWNINLDINIDKKAGVTKTYEVVKSFYEVLRQKDFFASMCFKLTFESGSKTMNGLRFSTIINKIFGTVTTQEEFESKVEDVAKCYLEENYFYSDNRSTLDKIVNSQPDAREVKKAALKRKTSGAFNRIMDDLDFVDIDKEKYPLTYEAVHSGDVPLATFFRKAGESYFVYNDNWELWEVMLKDYRDITIKIASEASRRTTYEKDIMSYFYFTLYGLPEYLEKHTGKKWKGIPKLVSSSNELEPPKEGDNGVAKSRSALTPIVDNEKCEIVVPYVSMQVSGYQTTYCYGLDFQVLQRGFSFKGNAVTQSLEKALNGRDDYGLMFYTLTGSAQACGYPTFLIIFEHLDDKTKVHFHRTHPFRSKNGDYNPVHSWITGCYKWMIGNVNFDRIKAQQGDLAFVSIDEFPEGEVTEVNSYDSHCFASPVKFTPYVKKDKQNVLGYVKLDEDTTLRHAEHRHRTIPAGAYEIRQCRSWEANPKGIWSLRID